jgi:hypothetical protein
MIQNAFILLSSVLFCDILSIPIQMLYPFGAQYGDSGLARGDDMTSSAMQISMSFPFFNNSHDYLYVSIIFGIMKNNLFELSIYIMGRNFKQCKPTSTKRTMTSHLNSLTLKKTTTYDVGNPDPGFGQAHNCGLKRLIGTQPSPFENQNYHMSWQQPSLDNAL